MRNLQIGVIGSCSDLNYSQRSIQIARSIGKNLAYTNCTLVFGAEKDSLSLSTEAALSARKNNGLTIGVTYDIGLEIFKPESASVVIATGLVRGGGREMVQSLSCDSIIAIAGGSGTLNEICVAYQAGIPVVVIDQFPGWSANLSGKYLDARKRYRFRAVKSARQAVAQAVKLAQVRINKEND
ncbi:hypothetical protein KDA23_04750 [Candidatus Saccharibacteria bacterium]|nr:hypothetical protein [Candidatus Saccharibacteria bacterium]MCB9821576.1 hypothetical protein [Candidatus Nomurabacteria bacterium]